MAILSKQSASTLSQLVADQCSIRALVYELVASPLEQILSGLKHLGLAPEDVLK